MVLHIVMLMLLLLLQVLQRLVLAVEVVCLGLL